MQAARAQRLGLAEESARSWGLNRAIFYAMAKQRAGRATGEPVTREAPSARERAPTYLLGDEMAYRDPASSELRFAIGGEVQSKADFDRQIAARFGSERNFRSAWKEAEEVVRAFDEATLASRSGFYSRVYRPRRDMLAAKWTEEFVGIPAHEGTPPSRTAPRP